MELFPREEFPHGDNFVAIAASFGWPVILGSIQQRFSDDSAAANSGLFIVMVGGPLNSFGTAGVGLDRTFQGNFIVDTTRYSIQMSH